MYSIFAQISHQTDLFGHQFTGKGEYREQRAGPVPRVRLDLKIPMNETGDKIGSLVQVCDGRYLWTYRRLLDAGKLTRVDLEQVAREVGPTDEAIWASTTTGPIGAGGLAGVLRGLRRRFTFEVLADVNLSGMAAWQLRGTWKAEELANLLPNQKAAIREGRGVDLARLPSHLPDHVILFLGKEDLFPYHFEYRRMLAGGRDWTASRALVKMSLPTVSINVPIDPSHFQYGRSGIEPTDETPRFIQTLKQNRHGS